MSHSSSYLHRQKQYPSPLTLHLTSQFTRLTTHMELHSWCSVFSSFLSPKSCFGKTKRKLLLSISWSLERAKPVYLLMRVARMKITITIWCTSQAWPRIVRTCAMQSLLSLPKTVIAWNARSRCTNGKKHSTREKVKSALTTLTARFGLKRQRTAHSSAIQASTTLVYSAGLTAVTHCKARMCSWASLLCGQHKSPSLVNIHRHSFNGLRVTKNCYTKPHKRCKAMDLAHSNQRVTTLCPQQSMITAMWPTLDN